MEICDLMLGDIIRYKDNIYKVIGILGLLKEIDLSPLNLKDKDGKYLLPISVLECNIEPIPLTKEILMANGFEYVDEVKRFYLYNEDECMFCITKRPNGKFWIPVSWYGKGICLEQVHQLQHALRLCRLNGLADNFKVV